MLELDSINYFDRLINDCSDMKSGLMKTIVDKYNVKSCVELFGSIISDIAGFKILTLEEMFHHLEWLQKIWIHQFRLHTYEETEVMKKSSQKAVKLLEIEVEELEAKNDNIQTEYSDKLTQINKEKREVHMKEIIVAVSLYSHQYIFILCITET
jgi:FtsZ-binding cell division protein ZapB